MLRSKYNHVSFLGHRLLEGFQQNDGVDGFHRHESREKFAASGRTVKHRRSEADVEKVRREMSSSRKEEREKD